MSATLNHPNTIKTNAGTSQLLAVGGEFRTSSKTSPGVAKTFNSRPISDKRVGGASSVGSVAGWSIKNLSHYELERPSRPSLVAHFDITAICFGVKSHSSVAQRPACSDSIDSLQSPPFFMTTKESGSPVKR